MLALLAILLPILLVDVLNPVLFALLVLAAGSERPVLNSSNLLIGHTAAYFVAGIVVSFGLEQISERLQNPQQIDFAVGGAIGALLIWVFFSMRLGKSTETADPAWELTPMRCLGLGAVVNFMAIPFALPYFGAIDQILKADIGFATSLAALALYNLGYALVFAIVPISVALAGNRVQPMLEGINRFLVKASDFIMPWMILVLSIWLLFDSARYFIVGDR